jgi:hypothetical protein
MIDAIASAVRMLAGRYELTPSELTLSTVGGAALLLTPALYGVRHLARRVWPITPRVVETAARLQRALLASLGTYALLALGARVLATFTLAAPAPTLSPGGSLLAFVLAMVSAVVAWLLPQGRKRGG